MRQTPADDCPQRGASGVPMCGGRSRWGLLRGDAKKGGVTAAAGLSPFLWSAYPVAAGHKRGNFENCLTPGGAPRVKLRGTPISPFSALGCAKTAAPVCFSSLVMFTSDNACYQHCAP